MIFLTPFGQEIQDLVSGSSRWGGSRYRPTLEKFYIYTV